MKRLICAALALATALALCACGGAGEPDSPYLGVWTAVSARFDDGTELDIAEVYPEGMVLELRESGVCQLTLGEQSDPASWSESEGNLTISDGETDLLGTIDDSAIILELSGVYITLIREGADGAPAETESAPPEEPAEETPAETESAPPEAPAEEAG